MYNDVIKNKFLDSLPTLDLKRMYCSLFSRTSEYEEELNKDILDFDIKECTKLIFYLNPKSVSHVGSLKSQFNKYVDWGIQNSLVAKNCWVLVPQDDNFARQSFLFRYVKNLEELEAIVEIGLSVPYDKYVVYLLYMGIMGTQFSGLASVKDSEVDVLNRRITTANIVYPIFEPLYNAIVSSGYYEETKKRNEGSIYFVKPYNTKHTKDNPITYQHVHRVFTKLNKEYNKVSPDNRTQFAPMTIWRSGLFNALYEIEKIKGSIVSDDFKEVSRMYGNKNTYSSYQRDYDLYKEIFWGS